MGNRIIDRKSRIGQTVIAADLLSGDIIGRTLDGKANCLDYSLTMATIGAFHYPRSDVKLVPYNFSFGKGKKENFSTPLTHDHYGFTFFNEDEKVHFAVTFAGEIPLDILMDNTALRQFIDENAVRDPDFYTEEKKREVLYHLYGMRNGIRTAFPDLANVYRNTPEVETEISE